ncbi:hypothetical protein BST27_24120 [Mycobacterium intermedium]|uniref:Uncharacterized protein n=1 Tax=Mycobacterium intermedium TaxID=28445 RepID=A0A1T3WB66_MYCIE|nr:hypothetical protein BV508_05620 [Mycobacterium intermedium]ORA96778.1 hypothetical protein BST27_24120 [Mycobacterium intermedium]
MPKTGRISATNPQRRLGVSNGRWRRVLTPEKGRPPPGGEEARVVVHQPRGVGLIHSRLEAE